MEGPLDWKITSIKTATSVQDAFFKENELEAVFVRNIQLFNETISEGKIIIFDINSSPSSLPYFLRNSINQKEEIDKIRGNPVELTCLLLKDPLRKNIQLKHSQILSFNVSFKDSSQQNRFYVEEEKIAKTLKVYDLKSNFNPST